MREFDYICLRQPIDFLKMSKYLDPKADLTFKKVFGEHRDLVVSFLNAAQSAEKVQCGRPALP